MKGYKNLIPIALILFAFVSCYTRFNETEETRIKYNNLVEQAREYREEKIYVDAITAYEEALGIEDSIELNLEIGQMYYDMDDAGRILNWGETMISKFPTNIEPYEYVIDYHLKNNEYDDCFEYYEIVKKRNLYSENLAAKIDKIMYEYEIKSGGFEEVSDYSEDCATIKKDEIYRYVNSYGSSYIDGEYLYAGAYSDGLAPVCDINKEFYFIDTEGNRKLNYSKNIEVPVTKLGYIDSDLYPVGNNEKVYYANTSGDIVYGPYQDASVFNYEVAAVKENNKWHLIDIQGNKISDDYEYIVQDFKNASFRNGVAFAKTENGYYMISSDGKKINKKPYEDVKLFLDFTYAAVKQNGLWGFVDNEGEFFIEPAYEDANSYRNGFAAVKKDGLWGYINEEGKLVIKPNFTEAGSMTSEGTAFVKEQESEKWSVMSLIRYNYYALR